MSLRPAPSPRIQDAVALLVAAGIALFCVSAYQEPLMDDVYITMQHARNLAEGHGLSYHTDARVLGTTSPLYAWLLTPAYLYRDGERAIPLVALEWVLAVAGCLFLIWKLLDRSKLGFAIACLGLLNRYMNGSFGMETAIFMLAIAAAFLLYRRRRFDALGLAAGLALLVRPDAVFVIAALAASYLVEYRRIPWRPLGLFMIPVGAWLVFSWFYYGSPLPLSFIGKYYQGKSPYWGENQPWMLIELGRYASEHRALAAIVLLAIPGAVMAFIRRHPLRPVIAQALTYAVLTVAAYSSFTVPPYVNYYPPVLMSVFLFAGAAISAGWDALVPRARRSRVRAAWSWPLFAGAMALLIATHATRRTVSLAPTWVYPSDRYLELAAFLREHTPPGSTVAVAEVGILGYYSRRKIIDMSGLVTPGVAWRLGHNDSRYAVDQLHPDYIVVRLPRPWGIEGVTEEELARDYERVFEYDDHQGQHIGLFARRNDLVRAATGVTPPPSR